MSKLTLLVKQLPLPVKFKWGCISYFGVSVIYSFVGSYNDSKKYLIKFRTEGHTSSYTTEWEAVKYGARINFEERLFSSMFWPYSLSKDVIPNLVILLNKT